MPDEFVRRGTLLAVRLTVAIAMFDALNICVARCTGGFLARLTLNSAEGVKPVEHEVDSILST